MFDLGLTAGQRIAVYIIFSCLADTVSTPVGVSNTKVFAHITASSQQRARVIWAKGLGTMIHEMLVPTSMALVGLHKVFGWSQHGVFLAGALAMTIPTIFLDMAPTFVLQRVPDKIQPPASDRTGIRGLLLEIKESFSIARHNRYLVLNLAARFVTALTPGVGDWDYYNYCGVNEVMGASNIKGETLVFIRDNIVSAPCNLIVPFAIPIIKKFGGPRNTQVFHQIILTVCIQSKWLVGLNSIFGVLFNWLMEMLNRTFGRVQAIAEEMTKFDMLDYVEWKTGRRSEGVTESVDGLLRKLVMNNIDKAIGNLVIDALGFDPKLPKQPALFLKWAPVLYLLVPAIDNFIILIARILYKYPAELRNQVEADLIERRRLAQEKLAEEELVTP